jgi:hypothetical protein
VVVVVKNSSSRIALCRCAHPGGQNNQRSLGWGDPCSAAATSLPGVSNYSTRGRGKESKKALENAPLATVPASVLVSYPVVLPSACFRMLSCESCLAWWFFLGFHVHILFLYAYLFNACKRMNPGFRHALWPHSGIAAYRSKGRYTLACSEN